ncbi:Alpha/Beta hydrolase protein [Aspergillus bertholletiae]|uniref:Alpha/Beta hydrolase protein n=1 Tax=Aspergillus bertholletiae TaxID=1226010 RepID=A0A5N7BJ30_9EURO|nr:Alpha/Beta hydrolase protein [Aspergillus bertholletiae]
MISEALVSLLAITRTTDLAARFTGVRPFLPLLSATRFGTVGGISQPKILFELKQCKSFNDDYWPAYWTSLAELHLLRLDTELKRWKLDPKQAWLENEPKRSPSPDLLAFLARGSTVITQTPPGTVIDANDSLNSATPPEILSSRIAVDALVKAIAYLFIAAWPGRTPNRDKAYYSCEALFDILLDAVAPTIDLKVERHIVRSQGEEIKVYGLLPEATQPNGMPGVLFTNGLEGTNVESIMTVLRTRSIVSSAWFFMEMPGTYRYKRPLCKDSSEQIYGDVLSFIESHSAIDRSRLGMVGVSFGGNCATRMAIADKRLKAVVINGAPLARSLSPRGSFGMPEIIVRSLFNVVGADGIQALMMSLHSLHPCQADIERIHCPVLAINGERDTLVSTQDTIDLANWVPRSELMLFPDDDHCAIGHIREWQEHSSEWLMRAL